MANIGTEIIRGSASAYVMDEQMRQWQDRCASGTIVMYQHTENNNATISIKLMKHNTEFWWTIVSSKLRKKGERSWIMKATVC